jgi:hypothetical protein
MLRLTVREVLECDDQGGELYNLYLYRDGDVVFYIGQSGQPFERLREHLGQGERNLYDPDAIGQLILNNRPASLAWVVEVYSLAEMQGLHGIPVRLDKVALDSMERELIMQRRPCLNRTLNKNRTPLPLRYIKDSAIANEGVILE